MNNKNASLNFDHHNRTSILTPGSFTSEGYAGNTYMTAQTAKTKVMTNDKGSDNMVSKRTPQSFLKSVRHNRKYIASFVAQAAKNNQCNMMIILILTIVWELRDLFQRQLNIIERSFQSLDQLLI